MSKDLVLIDNDKVTFIDKFNKKRELIISLYNGFSINKFEEEGCKVLKVERPVKYETIYEVKEVLDEIEKKWLGNFVRPFRSKIYDIVKYRFHDNSGEWLQIRMKDSPDIDLPYFKLNKMYKGMEINKDYTLEELGL